MRTLALSMPGAEEKAHFGKPDFRVNNKIFAGLTELEHRAYIKARPELQDMLLASRSGAFSPAAGAWGRSGWTYIELPKVELGMLREIVLDAWKLVAPKRLVASHAADVRGESGAAPRAGVVAKRKTTKAARTTTAKPVRSKKRARRK